MTDAERELQQVKALLRDLAGETFMIANPNGRARVSSEDVAGNARIIRQAVAKLAEERDKR